MPRLEYPRTSNEPRMHSLIRKSFAFLPTVGMRSAPEELLLELFREVFYETHYESGRNNPLDPEADPGDAGRLPYTKGEKAVLYALQGRRKKTRNSRVNRYYGPAYPALARNGWFGKNRERIVKEILFSGIVAQHLWHRGPDVKAKKEEQDRILRLLVEAFIGRRAVEVYGLQGSDILSAALADGAPTEMDRDLAWDKLLDATGYSDKVMRLDSDRFASRICDDLCALCELEGELPRMQWLSLLMTFLRFSLPVYALAQMRLTSMVLDLLVDAIDEGTMPDQERVERSISGRHEQLMRPTITPTREVFEQVEEYIRHRVELNVLLYAVDATCEQLLLGKSLCVKGGSADRLSLVQLSSLCRENSDAIRAVLDDTGDGLPLRNYLVREAEKHLAWKSPRKRGQGKNIDEFLRVMYRDDLGDESGGYLLRPVGRGAARGLRVFPGQMLLKTMTHLAAKKKFAGSARERGRFVLADVEAHFADYGIDFRDAVGARPRLIEDLTALGLLRGSPDAGSSVAISHPY